MGTTKSMRERRQELEADIERWISDPDADPKAFRNIRVLFEITTVKRAQWFARQLDIPAVKRDLRIMVRWTDVESVYNTARDGGLTLAELLETVGRLPPGVVASRAGGDRVGELLQLLLNDTDPQGRR